MKLSVIIPGYNNPDCWWQRCVDSVVRAGADEIICVDDGSSVQPTIGVGNGCRCTEEEENIHCTPNPPTYTFSPTHPTPKIKWLYLPGNVGLASARNAGLAEVTGDYVTFVDSDDELEPETIDRCKAALEATQADIAIYGVRVVWPEDGLQKIDTFEKQETLGKLTPEQILDLHKRCLLNYSCNKVYRVAFLKEHGLDFNPEGMPYEDIIFNLNCIMAGATYCTVPYAGYVYYRTRGTLLSKYKKTSSAGTHIASDTWRKYKDVTPGAYDCLGELGEISAVQELRAEWRNIWMPGNPYGLVARWRWLRSHPQVGGTRVYVKMLVFMFFRRHFYIRPVRRWNTRRTYPSAAEWHGEDVGGRCRCTVDDLSFGR